MRHLIPLFEGAIIFLGLEFFLFKPEWLIYIIIAATVFIILGTLAPKKRFLSKKEFWHYLSSPLIFIWSGMLLLMFFENIYLRHLFVLGLGIYVVFYFENLFHHLISGSGESRDSFLRITNLMNVVSIFFLSAAFYGIKTFIQLPLWTLIIIFFIFSVGLIYSSLWAVRKRFKAIFWETLVVAIIISEFFGVIYLLPIGFYASGALVGIIYYILSGILINYEKQGKLSYKRYIIVGLILLLLILFTARWV